MTFTSLNDLLDGEVTTPGQCVNGCAGTEDDHTVVAVGFSNGDSIVISSVRHHRGPRTWWFSTGDRQYRRDAHEAVAFAQRRVDRINASGQQAVLRISHALQRDMQRGTD